MKSINLLVEYEYQVHSSNLTTIITIFTSQDVLSRGEGGGGTRTEIILEGAHIHLLLYLL